MEIWQRLESMRRADEVENCEPLHCERSGLSLEQEFCSIQQATVSQIRVVYVPPGISLQYIQTKNNVA